MKHCIRKKLLINFLYILVYAYHLHEKHASFHSRRVNRLTYLSCEKVLSTSQLQLSKHNNVSASLEYQANTWSIANTQ